MCIADIWKSLSWTKDPGTPSCNIGAADWRRSLRAPDNGGSSIGDVPFVGEREFEDESEIRDGGAPPSDM